MNNNKDYTGSRILTWDVVNEVESPTGHGRYWLCRCYKCGAEKVVSSSTLANRNSFWCECSGAPPKGNAARKHGMCNTQLYNVWKAIRQRCNNKNDTSAKHYHDKGIRMCDEWNDYTVFHEWAITHGYQLGLTIERIDISKGYCPENCTWITKEAQHLNTSRNVFIEYNGKTQTISQWAEELGFTQNELYHRLHNKNYTIEEAFGYKKHEKRSAKYVDYDGKHMTIKEWAKYCGINYATLKGRLLKGWTFERAITTPVRSW